MRSKGLIGLLAVTVVAAAAAGLMLQGGAAPKSDPLVGTPVLPEVAKRLTDVGRIALARGAVKTTLVRQGDDWAVEERGNYAADGDKVHKVLLGLAELAFIEPKTAKPDLYPRLEVEDADKAGAKSTLVTVSDLKGSLLGEVIAGKHRVDQLGGGNDGVYVRKPGDARSWLARGTLDLTGDTPQWLDKKLLDLPAAQVKSMIFTAADGTALPILRGQPSDKFALGTAPPAGKRVKSDSTLDAPAEALAGLELTDVRPAKEFDFPKDGTATARYEGFDGLVLTIALTQKDGIDWLRIAAAGSGASEKPAADLNARLAPWVFAVANFKAKTLQTKLADLVEDAKGS